MLSKSIQPIVKSIHLPLNLSYKSTHSILNLCISDNSLFEPPAPKQKKTGKAR